MNAAVPYLLAVLMGYLFGCSNMAFYLSRLRGVDMRSSGSGNLGASNAMVLMGWASGVLVAIHDIAKGTLAGWLAGRLFPSAPFIGLVACVGAVLGHNFPFYLGFKGGKGFATYFGMVVFFDWKFALSLALANVVITLITDYIVIATMTTIAVFPVFVYFTAGWIPACIVLVASLTVLSKHRENFRRMRDGTEVGLRKANRGDYRVKKE